MSLAPDTYRVIDLAALEDWSVRVAQILQDVCDDAQMAAGNPDGTDQLPDIRALLEEHSRIMNAEVMP